MCLCAVNTGDIVIDNDVVFEFPLRDGNLDNPRAAAI